MPSDPESPATFNVTLITPQGERTMQVSPEEHIWDAAHNAGIILPALCHQGRCLTCAARLVNGGEVDQSDSVSYFSEDRAAGFVLPCTGKARSDLTLRTHQAGEMRTFRRAHNLPSPYS